ncbi:hypothetical protein [Emticicia sp. 17c]|uniref:hypothetical protein n=1 Tax=Emticicia sp. 17c TaxID=3127704 RepID=UPI00301CD391
MKDTIIEKFANRLVRFEPTPFDTLLQDKTKKYLYEIGVPGGTTVGGIEMSLNGELTLLPENKIQISYPEEKRIVFYLDPEKNDALCYGGYYTDNRFFANSSLENYMYCLYELEDFYENIYSKRMFGEPDGEDISKKYAKYLEERIRQYEQDLTFWRLEIEEIGYGWID